MPDPQNHSRREFLIASAAASYGVLWNRHGSAHEAEDENQKFALHAWERDPRNPIFVPRSEFDASGAQGPFVVLHDGQWWMFYAGIGNDGIQRICLATANPEKPTEWERHGPILELGAKDAFDERSATYPCVHRIGAKWHLYYSGRSSREGKQHFSNYWGIGLAQSDDHARWSSRAVDSIPPRELCTIMQRLRPMVVGSSTGQSAAVCGICL